MANTLHFILIAVLISTVSVTTVYAQESLLPGWIKTIAGFWSDNQISDEEFVGALQYLVKEGILVIPSEQTQIDPPSLELDSGPSDNTVPSKLPSQKITPQIEAAFLRSDTLMVLVSLADEKGNTIAGRGDLTLKFLDDDDNELYSEKKYLTVDVFKEHTNDVSGETITAIKYSIDTGKFRATDWQTGWYHGYDDVKAKVIFDDSIGLSQTNQLLISHFPINEGFFSEDTGFVKNYETSEILNLGPFFIKIPNVGPYMATVDGKTDEYFRVNWYTQHKQVSDIQFTIDEMYILDDQNNLYSPIDQNLSELKKVFSIDYGYVLFEEIPADPSKITIFLKITVIEQDSTDTPYEDSAEITLR